MTILQTFLMHINRYFLLAFLLLLLSACSQINSDNSRFDNEDFDSLLQTLATGWNTNNARLAASVFAEDAIYSEPPDKQLYKGRNEIFEFFGGQDGRESWMKMTWHHTSFDPVNSVGSREFTFGWPGGNVHGIVSIRIENGLIRNWREYFYEDPANWEEFSKNNPF